MHDFYLFQLYMIWVKLEAMKVCVLRERCVCVSVCVCVRLSAGAE